MKLDFKFYEKLEKDILEREVALTKAIYDYFSIFCYGNNPENDIYGKHKKEILEELISNLSDCVFEGTNGWIRFDVETVDIDDQGE